MAAEPALESIQIDKPNTITLTNGVTKTYETYSRTKSRKGVTVRLEATKKPKKLDWAYLAGFYDGEGTVSATRQVRKTSFYYQLRFVISNTQFALLSGLMEMFGGSIHIGGMSHPVHWKQVYMWHVESKENCLYILRGILPYLRYKTREAELAIEFFANLQSPVKNGQGLANEEIERRARIVREIRSIPGRRTLRGQEPVNTTMRDFTRKCVGCKKIFERETTTAKYCSVICRVAARQKQYSDYNLRRRRANAEWILE